MDEDSHKYSDEVEEEIDSASDAAKDIYDIANDFNGNKSNEETSPGDAVNDDATGEKQTGSQAEAGEKKDPSSNTSEGKTDTGSNNPNSLVGEQSSDAISNDIASSAISDATIDAASDAAGEAIIDGTASAAAEGAATGAATEAASAAAGTTVGGPVGTLAGLAVGFVLNNFSKVLLVIVGIIIFVVCLLGAVLGSWNPSIFDDATLIWDNRRSEEAKEITKDNDMNAAITSEELAQSFNLLKPLFVNLRSGQSSGNVTEEKWDGAYLVSAYSVYKQMYAGKTNESSAASGSAAKLIEAAKSQVGQIYPESGSNPYAEYVTGVSGAGGAWCQYFVSWCANEAGISTDVIPKCGLCSDGMNFFISQGRFYYESSSYTPEPGDIIYFDNYSDGNYDGQADHVGIVVSATSSTVCTIEGNTGDATHYDGVCAENLRDRPGTFSQIIGYGKPNFAVTETTTEVEDEETSDDSESDSIDSRYKQFYIEYDDSTTNYIADMTSILTRFIKYAVVGEDVTYNETTIKAVDVPVYEQQSVKVIENGLTVTRIYYVFNNKYESRTENFYDYEYTPVTIQLAEPDSLNSNTTYYTRSSEKTVFYEPTIETTQKTKHINSILSKSAVLYAMNLPADELYQGDIDMNATNAEYVDYLRETMIETLGITEDAYGQYGMFIWPADPEKYGNQVFTITDYFGYRSAESTGGIGSTNHQGIDISWSGCYGAEVRAPAGGTIVASGYTSGYGNYVQIDHGNGYVSILMHLAELPIVNVGDTVTQGQTVGYVGSTGPSTGPHIHWGVYSETEGSYVDPLQFFIESTDENGNTIYLASSGNYEARDPAEYRDMIIQAMNELGITVTEDKVQRVISQIATESGGDPLAIQHGYTDVNTNATIANWTCPWCPTRCLYRSDGYTCENYNRAHGLMQTISTTFLAYKIEGHDDIYNAYDNLLAALNYIKHNYPDDFSGIGEGHGY